jgi:hypothetical protein
MAPYEKLPKRAPSILLRVLGDSSDSGVRKLLEISLKVVRGGRGIVN